jgi:hypothetical protein
MIGVEEMKPMRTMVVLLCLLLHSPLYGEEERYSYGKVWNNWTDIYRSVYLWGFKDGMTEGWNDLERFFHKTFQKDWTPYVDRYTAFYRYSLSQDFPDMKEVREVMTAFYADTSNTYLEPAVIFLVAVAKIRGASPDVIDRLLETARKKSRQLHMMRQKKKPGTEDIVEFIEGPSFSSMAYEEIYGEKE